MVSIARRKKITAVLSETSVIKQSELMTSLSAEELSLLQIEIVKRLGDKPSERLRKLLATARLITLLRVARKVLFRESSEQLGRQVNRAKRRRLMAESRRDDSHG